MPPQNKPLPAEIRTCNAFLSREMQDMTGVRVYLALGRVAHEAVLLARGLKRADYPFAHAGEHLLGGGVHLIDSYHCSRYNTQTRRLTARCSAGRGARLRAGAAAGAAAPEGRLSPTRMAAHFDHKQYIAALPRRPGVYRMFGAEASCCTSARRAV